jgi:Bifunctional DNA primase/polymerase, N-terminal
MSGGVPGELPPALAKLVGVNARPLFLDEEPLPSTMLDWALRWASRRLRVFPCKSWLGSPIPPKWYRSATYEVAQLVEWWSETPDADIACVPDLSGHFVLSVVGDDGLESLDTLESKYGELAPMFVTESRWGALHYWFAGRALSSRNLLGPGLIVYGPGSFVYMPASLAPDPD